MARRVDVDPSVPSIAPAQVVAVSCNGLSLLTMAYLLVMRWRRGGAEVMYHMLRPLERFLPASFSEKRKAVEQRSIAQLITRAAARVRLPFPKKKTAGRRSR